MSSEELNLSLSGESLKCKTEDADLYPQAVMARGFGGVLPSPLWVVGVGRTPQELKLVMSFQGRHNLFTVSFLFLPVRFAKDSRR